MSYIYLYIHIYTYIILYIHTLYYIIYTRHLFLNEFSFGGNLVWWEIIEKWLKDD